MKVIEAKLDAAGLKFGIIVSRFNDFVTDKLLEGALDGLKKHGCEDSNIHVVRVPGSFEIPLVASKMAAGGKYDALICLGAVIKGETAHFEYISGEVTRGIGQVVLRHGIPIAFGVLTTYTVEQAMERAGNEFDNKGYEAALTAIEMVCLGKEIS